MAVSRPAEVARAVVATMLERGLQEGELRARPTQVDELVDDISLWSLVLPEDHDRPGIATPDDLCIGRFDLTTPVPAGRFVDELFVALANDGLVRHDVYPSDPRQAQLAVHQRSWRLCRDDLPLELMADPEPAETDQTSGADLTLEDLRSSDLYAWFNLTEGTRSTVSPDLTRVELQPGAFSQSIGLAVGLESSGVIASASLALERSFLDEDKVHLAAATDLTASLLRFLAGSDPFLAHVARQLEAAGLEAAGALSRVNDAPTLDPFLLPLLQLFLASLPGRQTLPGRRLLRSGNLPGSAGRWFGARWGGSGSERKP